MPIPTVISEQRKKYRDSKRTGSNANNLINIKCLPSAQHAAKDKTRITYWNARSINNKITCLHNYLSSDNCDVLALTETWLSNTDEKNQVTLSQIIPSGYNIKHISRSEGKDGGGVAVIYKDTLSIQLQKVFITKQFESICVRISFNNHAINLAVVYRPPPTKKNKLKLSSFWPEWSDYLSALVLRKADLVVVGDLNFHLDIPKNPNTTKFVSTLSEFGLEQHITVPTHQKNHTLDVLITREDSNSLADHTVTDLGFVTDLGKQIKDHLAIKCTLYGNVPDSVKKSIVFRDWKKVDREKWTSDLQKLLQELEHSTDCNHLVNQYYSILQSLSDKYAPLKTKIVRSENNPWYNKDINEMKTQKRRLERKWLKSKLSIDHQIYKDHCQNFYNKISYMKRSFYEEKISSSSKDLKKMFSLTNLLMGRKSKPILPERNSDKELADRFSKFFKTKIKKIKEELELQIQNESFRFVTQSCLPQLSSFSLCSEEEIRKILTSMSNKQCLLDPIPTWFLKENSALLCPLLTLIINSSLSTGIFPRVIENCCG